MPRKQTRKGPPAEKKPRKTAERVRLDGAESVDLADLKGMLPISGPRSDYDRELAGIQAESEEHGSRRARLYPLAARKGFQDRAKKLGLKLGLGESGGKLVVWVEGKEEGQVTMPSAGKNEHNAYMPGWTQQGMSNPANQLSPILEPELTPGEALAALTGD